MISDRLRVLAVRLRTVNDPEAQAVADELEKLARGPGRPADPPAERVLRRARRWLVAEALFAGTFPVALVPDDLRFRIPMAKKNRAEADEVAAIILGVSSASITKARRAPMLVEGDVDELMALVGLIAGGLGTPE